MNTVNFNEDVSQKLHSHEDMQVLRKIIRHIINDKTKQESNHDRRFVYRL